MKSKKDKNKSSITTYTTVAVGILLMLCACFTFLIFSTDTLFNIETGELANHDSLFNRTDVTTVIETVEVDDNGATSGNLDIIIDSPFIDIPMSSSSWYDVVPPDSLTYSSTIQDTFTLSRSDVINVYSGMPFDVSNYSGTMYYFNLDKAKKDVETWWGCGTVTKDEWCFMYRTKPESTTRQHTYFDTNANLVGFDAVNASDIPCLCVNLAPCYVTNDYNDNFKTEDLSRYNWMTYASADANLYGYTNKTAPHPVVLLVENKKSGALGYLPVEPWAKAHTWPGGVFQTQVSLGEKVVKSNTPTTFTVDTGDWGTGGWGYFKNTTKDTAWSDYQNWYYYDNPEKPCATWLGLSYEVSIGSHEDVSFLTSNYRVLGSYMWR